MIISEGARVGWPLPAAGVLGAGDLAAKALPNRSPYTERHLVESRGARALTLLFRFASRFEISGLAACYYFLKHRRG